MPILTVEIVLLPGETTRPELAQRLADGAGEIFSSPPGSTWVKLIPIPAKNYAENKPVEEAFYPVFVTVLKATLPPPESMQAEAAQLTAAIALICGRPPGNIHIIYAPAGAGRVAFGGKLLPDAHPDPSGR